MRCIKPLLPLLALVAAVVVGMESVAAQGGADQDDIAGPVHIDRNVTVGGYDLFVEATASNLSLGTALVSVAVLNAVTREPVPGATVAIHTRHINHGETGWATALPVPERPEIYRARMKLDRPGQWDMNVEVDGPLGQVETRVGTVTIPEPRQYWVGSVVFAGMSLILLSGAGYVAWTIRRAMKRREAANAV